MKKKEHKLTIEMVPQTLWHNNLRNLLGKEAWDVLRHKVYKDHGYCCGICKAKGKLACHEIWEYDDAKRLQKLSGLIALCENCHNIKHFGLSNFRADKGELELNKLIEHFMKVNKCDRDAFKKHKEEAVKLFNERSKHEWKVQIGDLNPE